MCCLFSFLYCSCRFRIFISFFFDDTATTEIYTLSLHDALPIFCESSDVVGRDRLLPPLAPGDLVAIRDVGAYGSAMASNYNRDRKSTRLNSSHTVISYAVFCLKKKKNKKRTLTTSTVDQSHHDR